MHINEIQQLWEVDAHIEKTDLDSEALKVPKLHHKYFKIYTEERLRLRKLESEMKVLKLEKHEFYSQGPTKESNEKGWKLPAKGIILKSDIPLYMDADPQIIELSIKIGLQLEKIDFLDSIIKTINTRNFSIRAAIDFIKFTHGT